MTPPSEAVSIQVAMSASGTERSTTEYRWAALGFALPGLLTEVWGMQESRMEIDSAVDTSTRYDVVTHSSVSEPETVTVERIRRAITHQLELSVNTHVRSMEIWVLSAPDTPVARSPVHESGCGAWEWNSDWVRSPPEIPATPGAIEEWLKSQVRRIPAIGVAFRQDWMLLPFSGGVLLLGNPEEDGSTPVQIEGMWAGSEEQLLRAVRDDLGIAASKERRDVEMLVVRPRLQ